MKVRMTTENKWRFYHPSAQSPPLEGSVELSMAYFPTSVSHRAAAWI